MAEEIPCGRGDTVLTDELRKKLRAALQNGSMKAISGAFEEWTRPCLEAWRKKQMTEKEITDKSSYIVGQCKERAIEVAARGHEILELLEAGAPNVAELRAELAACQTELVELQTIAPAIDGLNQIYGELITGMRLEKETS